MSAGSGEELFPRHSPLDGSALAEVEATPPERVPELVAKAREVQRTWMATSVRERSELLASVKKRLLERAEEIASLLRLECGKPVEEAVLAEVLPNADLVDYWVSSAEEFLEDTPVELDPLSYPGKAGSVRREPRGVIGLITPWNYPVAIPLRTLIPALLSGNAVIFKPSEITPRAGALVASLFDGLLPAGLLQLAQGGSDVGTAIIDAGVDLVVFTGSVATGRKVAVSCAERFIPVSLELGGKDAAIVLSDCNLERAARGIVWGAFTNAGQNCASIERVYVERPVAERFIDRVSALTRELKPGVDTAVLTTARQCAIVRKHLAEAEAGGAEVLVGGAPEEGSLEFPPTVVRVTHEDITLLQEETFGPILPIIVVESADEAIERTNGTRFGLTTSIWTRRYEVAQALARRLRSGVVTINNHGFTAAVPGAPWTGVGDSGHGVTNGPHALSDLTRPRFILEDRSGARSELWWYPYTPSLRRVAFSLAKVRGGAGFFGRIAAAVALIIALPKRLFGG
ncbi:aldehyde dehydrogenase family protein [Chondromyces apiculatus]|uniref:Aldehyde dehydrogenase n=1 Tax=Chondromyces apiculatus DSM 436 TaxID=1192034 RepID=A0A017SUP3_9BACT|nr:aldehyde dehydrogenase family protein [Chondromyces apiculatus]EYF00703.1 Aldehyde dehydrogenase [Chondromyces apiculatus DSM 436]